MAKNNGFTDILLKFALKKIKEEKVVEKAVGHVWDNYIAKDKSNNNISINNKGNVSVSAIKTVGFSKGGRSCSNCSCRGIVKFLSNGKYWCMKHGVEVDETTVCK